RDFSAEALASAKQSATVSVCLPARDEATTIGRIVGTIREDLVERVHLVDEVLVADDRSADATAAAAAGAGAAVVPVAATAGSQWGKGAAMATALAGSSGDLVVFLDADVEGFSSHFVVGLLGPLLLERNIGFVKATYQRPLAGVRGEGGRVTELTAKPLLALLRPDLACFAQPLAGEIAARRSVLGGLSLPPDYGVDIALLIDVAGRIGLGAMAEVDLGERRHRNRPLSELTPQARSVAQAILERSGLGTGALGQQGATVHATGFQTARAG
ncbi:MAG: glucosyl-3-phosphoglycerate synthase, partial [Actinomycetota bacterium]|nr:glucosyl-3-phosphoglycerate synthase [Actinomycetota bacterium]